jgi:splicing factor U2AF subunit
MSGEFGFRCTFFSKMGACRHGDTCTKLHFRPSSSPTVLFPMMYPVPQAIEHVKDKTWSFTNFDKKYLKKHFEHFYKDTWRTFMEFGKIAELRVVGNVCDHLLGNVYIKFEDPVNAGTVVQQLKTKRLNEIILLPELSPVTDFSDACCKEDIEGKCNRGLQCNFLHILKVSKSLMEKLEKDQKKFWKRKERDDTKGKRSRSRTPKERSRSPRRRTPEKVTEKGICFICGKTGHISQDCQLK